MQKKSHHIKRVESLIQGALAQIISQEIDTTELSLITVTQVQVSKDQSYAKIYVICHDEINAKDVIKKLKFSSKTLRHLLANKVQLRKTPELHFFYDDVLKQGIKISQMLVSEKLNAEKLDSEK